jgi:hypothetical protein
MTKLSAIASAALMLTAIWSTGHGTVIHVPEQVPSRTINEGILDAQNGDTVSVWGYGAPPFTYYENVDYQGKGVFVVNRSFLPGQTPGYDSSWDHVIVDGQQAAAVVTISSVPTAVATLKGFTIENGRSGFGGGVNCSYSSARLIRNRIVRNHATFRGGGVYLEGTSPERVVLAGNYISGNVSDGTGGGLAEVDVDYDSALVQGNTFDSDTARLYGGGIFLIYSGPMVTGRNESRVLNDNTITNDCVPDSAGPSGGGVYAMGWPFVTRRNVITGNAPDGVYTWDENGTQETGSIDLGRPEDPGYNVLMQNGGHDLIMLISHGPDRGNAVGNYWGTLNSQTMMTRILLLSYRGILLDPVAASGKWFDVNVNSRCTTGVIVTGDLPVEPGISLQFVPGDTIGFLLSPDYSCPGFDPTLCDLILQSGSTINAVGTSNLPIVFKGRPNLGDPEMAGDWYGISVCSQSAAMFSHCIVRSAYNGLDAFDSASLTVDTSSVYNNALCGVLATGGSSLHLVGDTISWNGVYGIRCVNVQPGTRIERNTLLQNAVCGISCEVYTSNQPSWVRHNRVTLTAPMPNSLFGIDLRGVGSNLAIDTNYVAHYPQAGIYEQTSSAPIRGDTIVNIQNDGIRCVSGSTPCVRRTMIDACKTGVLVDPTSLPDLGDDEEFPGLNSILLNNYRYVRNLHTTTPAVPAEYNWWGCAPPVAGKFIGWVDYSHYLPGPPPSDGPMGGGQSGGINSLQVPRELVLDQNWPNPATGSLTIRYGIPKVANVSLSVYDISGKLVRTLETNGNVEPGYYNINWSCRDNQDREVARGVYFYRLETSDGQQTTGGKPTAGVKTRKLLIAR